MPIRSLRERSELVNLLLDSTAEAIYVLDRKGRCIFCNASFLRLLGYQEEAQLLGRDLHPLIHHTRPDGSPYPPEECLAHRALHENSCIHVDDEVLWRSDGSSFEAEYWSHPILQEGKVIGTVVTFLDISERRRAEAETRHAFNELDNFVHTVAHDLRTPLTAIIGFTDLLKRDYAACLDDAGRVILDTIETEGDQMAALLEDLLALARVGRLPEPEAPVEVREVVQEVLAGMNGYLGTALQIQIDDLPAATLPRTLLLQVFTNLLGNAARYAGRKTIGIGGRRIRKKVRYYVRDHGPGIPEAERRRIFEPFYRGSTGKHLEGTGVGLAIVQKIARQYGGRAWVEETPGGGATFYVEFAAA